MTVSPIAENFLWTILSNREKKEIMMDISYVKPTAQHWLNFAKEIAENQTFAYWIDLAFTQGLWQFIATLPSMEITGSTSQAKCNSVLTMIYINATRIIFDRLLEKETDGIFSTNFTTELASCRNDDQMVDLVQKEFHKFLTPPTAIEQQMPKFIDSRPIVTLVLDFLKKENKNYQRSAISEVFAKVC